MTTLAANKPRALELGEMNHFPVIASDIIYAISGFTTLAPATLTDVTWLDLNVDGRAWAQ